MTQASTLLLALLTLHAVLGGLSLAVAGGGRRSPALRLWGWGVLAHGAGMFVWLATSLPWLIGAFGGGMISVGAALCASGAMYHTRVPLHHRWRMIAPAVTVLIVAVNHLLSLPPPLFDMAAPGPIAIGLFALAAWALLRHPLPHATTPARALAAALGLAAVLWIVWLGLLWTVVSDAEWPPDGAAFDISWSNLVQAFFSIAQMAAAVAATVGLLWIETRELEAVVERFTHTDPLTGLPNKRGTLARFKDELARSARHRLPFALVLLEVDRLRQISDTHGHAAADAVLQHVAEVLRGAVRGEDQVGHLGGEEFALLLPEQAVDGAEMTASRVRELVADSPCRLASGPLTVTMSAGLAVSPDEGREWDALVAAADKRMLAPRPRASRAVST